MHGLELELYEVDDTAAWTSLLPRALGGYRGCNGDIASNVSWSDAGFTENRYPVEATGVDWV